MPDSLLEGDTLYLFDVMFFKIIDRFLMVFSLLMSSFFNMQIVSWSDSINISDSLLVFIPLLLDLTGDICVRFWSWVSKNCSKKSIPSLSKETSLSWFGHTSVLFGRATVRMVMIVFEYYQLVQARILTKELPHSVGLLIITPWSSSVWRQTGNSISRAFPQVKNSMVMGSRFSMGSKFYFSQWKTYFFQFVDKFFKFEYMEYIFCHVKFKMWKSPINK